MADEPLEFRVDHTAITVSDLDRSIRWYGNFGFEKENQFDRKDLQLKGALLRLGGYRLELFQPYNPQAMEAYRRELKSSLQHIGPQHIALIVPDVEKAYEHLQGLGVEFAGEITTGKTARYVFCRDPDGMLVEVKQDLR